MKRRRLAEAPTGIEEVRQKWGEGGDTVANRATRGPPFPRTLHGKPSAPGFLY